MKRLFALLVVSLLPLAPLLADEQLTYPLHSRGSEPEIYVIKLLQLALDHSPIRYHLQPTEEPMNQSRAQLSLEHNQPELQVMWAMTTREREERLQPIRIPIYKGLIGWRVNLLRQTDSQLLSHVRTLDDLKALRFGQRHDWPDTPLLRANGLQVVTSPSYPGLFGMLAAGRFDAFPREVVTAWQEQAMAAQNGQALVVDEHVVLHYPSAFYFFTSRQRPELAEQIRLGLEAAIADGSFKALFQQHHAETLRRARLEQRQVIELNNPDLPDATPFSRKELWYQPESQPK
ncbi:MAG: transporter substrate-binding domain-containing protein [Pseudomonadaceae bacterium]|nr:transporter substrate-binding domain-containing protein [Pseudomonadaceae bacterium]